MKMTIYGKHVHLTRVLSLSLHNNTELGIGLGKYFANISEAIENITSPKFAKSVNEQRVNVTF